MPAESTASPTLFWGQTTDEDYAITLAETFDLAPTTPFFANFRGFITGYVVSDPSFTFKVTLDREDILHLVNGIWTLRFALSASTNPITVEIYDNADTGTKIGSFTSVSDSDRVYIFQARFTGSLWEKLDGRDVIA